MASTDARPIPRKAVAYRVTFPILDADGDLVTGAGSLDSEFSEDAATFADCASEATEIATGSGMYYLDLANTETDGDTCAVIVKSASGKTTPIVMYPEEDGDVRVDVTKIAGSAVSTSSAQLGVNVVNAGATAWGSGAITSGVFASGAITAASIAADAIGASELAADAVAEIADQVWDELMSGHLTIGSYGQWARGQGLTGEVNDAGATTTVFIVDGFTEATADHFNGSVICFTSGACAGQSRVINDYSVTTQQITLGEALTDAPADNDDFVIMPGSTFIGGTLAQIARLFVTVLNSSGQIQAGTIATDALANAKFAAGAISAAKFAAGAIDATVIAADAIGASQIAADAIGASELAASAVDEIWDEAMTEISAPPAVTASYRDALRWLFALARNKITQTATTQTLRNDADSGNLGTSAVSDDGTTATRGEWA